MCYVEAIAATTMLANAVKLTKIVDPSYLLQLLELQCPLLHLLHSIRKALKEFYVLATLIPYHKTKYRQMNLQ